MQTTLLKPKTIQVEQLAPNRAKVTLEPFERGYGHTLGNAMRRLLLSSLRGSAVWGFRIDGVLHEHQTIPGVVEDVHQIIGNLKNLTLTLPETLAFVESVIVTDALYVSSDATALASTIGMSARMYLTAST